MIEKVRSGNTGHLNSRIIYGITAIGGMRQKKTDSTLELVLKHGLNQFDVAASYGDAILLTPICEPAEKSDLTKAIGVGEFVKLDADTHSQ